MRILLLITGILIAGQGNSQCPFPVALTSTGNCPGTMLVLSTSAYLTRIVWQKDGLAVSSIAGDPHQIHTVSVGYYAVQPGSYTAALTNENGCTVTTPPIIIYPAFSAELSISATDTVICKGSPVTFTAAAGPIGFTPIYQWSVNGMPTGAESLVFTNSQWVDGDTVTCVMTNAATNLCVLAVSNPIRLQVNLLPQIDSAQTLSFSPGQSLRLDAHASGAIRQYAWTPSSGLSDSTIANPLAVPTHNILYRLVVTSPQGCSSSGTIELREKVPVRVPNAFTPNGDGRNDVLYVNGDPALSRVRDFVVFSRWGQSVFEVHDVPPGDAAYGWDGRYKGSAVPAGTYVYIAVIGAADGGQQTFRGTVLLLR